MNILSIQSWVAYGHVGNAAALFPLQRLGAQVWAVNTVQFSNHTGYGSFTGQTTGGPAIADLMDGIAALDVLPQVDAMLSGYLGDAATGDAVLEAVGRVRALRPDAIYCCDPVMGDVGRGLYVRPAIVTLFEERAVPAADILTPNLFELTRLTPDVGTSEGGLVEVARRARTLRARMRAAGPRLVLVTSVEAPETPSDCIDLVLAAGQGELLLRTPRLPVAVNGAGDLIAALFLLHMLRTGDPRLALELSASSVWGILNETARAGDRELRIVQAQQELVSPRHRFEATSL